MAESHKAREPFTAAEFREVMSYDPTTGVFTWLKNTGNMPYAGRRAGGLNTLGYVQIGVFGHRMLAHRLAWLWVTGKWPERDVDHADTNKGNNAWANLRLATASQNIHNARKHKDNTSGFKGVSWCTEKKKWKAQISQGGKNKFIGRYATAEEAHAAYSVRAEKVFGEFMRVN